MIVTKYIFIWNEDDVNCRKLKYKLKWKKKYDRRSGKWNLSKCKLPLTQKIYAR